MMTGKNWQLSSRLDTGISCASDSDDMFSDLPPLDPFEVKKQYLAADLAALIVHAGMSRSSVCEKLGWHKSALTRLLSGKSNPTAKTIWSIASLAGYDFDVVFREPSADSLPQPWSCSPETQDLLHLEVRRDSQYFVKVQTPEEVKKDVRAGKMSSIYFSVFFPDIVEMESASSANLTVPRDSADHVENTHFIRNTSPTTLQPVKLRIQNG